MSSWGRCALAISIVVALGACHAGSSESESSVSTRENQQPLIQLQANPNRVIRGNGTTLQWNATNATACTAEGGWSGTKPTSGSVALDALIDSTSFRLTCSGPGGSTTQAANVVVTSAPPTVALTATPTSVASGLTTALTWMSTDSSACTASGAWSGAVPISGTRTTTILTASAEFILTCTGSGGSATQSTTVTAFGSMPTVSISANPSSLSDGQSTMLTWSANDADTCVASGAWSGSKAARGSQSTGPISANSTYTITCLGSKGSTTQSVVISVPPAVPTVSIGAFPSTTAKGKAATLTWSSANAQKCLAHGAWSGRQPLSGSMMTSKLSSTSSFSLECVGLGGTASQSTTLTVNSEPAAPTVGLSVGPSAIKRGETSTLNWTASNAAGCLASGAWSGTRPRQGVQSTGVLTESATYTLTCTGSGGTAAQSATVSVTAPAPTISLSANPSSIASGGKSELTWTSANADSCKGWGSWSGSEPTSGSRSTGELSANSTYTLTCAGPGGTATQAVIVSVTEPAPQIALSASPSTVQAGKSATLNWAAKVATTCTAGGGWTGTKAPTGTKETVALEATTKFTLTCVGPGGSASQSATITVSAAAPSLSLTSSEKTVASGGTTQLSWSSSGATACSASGGWSGSLPTTGSQTSVALTQNTTFRLACNGPGGSVSESATVTVTGTANGTAMLSWTAPTTDTDGGAVTQLSGYRIYYGASATELTQSVNIASATTLSYAVTGLTTGTWYFAVVAEAIDGTESAMSAIESKTI